MTTDDIFGPYRDSYGLICMTYPNSSVKDGGDTHANEFTLLYCEPNRFCPYDFTQLTGPDGVPRRHPDTYKWYGRPNRQSRDQLIPRICWGAKHAPIDFAQTCRLLARHGFLFAFNTRRNFQYDSLQEHLERSTPDVIYDNCAWKLPDVIGPNVWAALLRGWLRHTQHPINKFCLAVALLPVLTVLDLQGLIGSLLLLVGIDKSNDQRNHAVMAHHAATSWPTPISLLSMCLFKACNPRKIFNLHWGQPGEPPVYKVLEKLY